MAVSLYCAIQRFMGFSSDTKPTSAPEGSVFFEIDTRNVYMNYGGQWVLSETIKDAVNVTKTIDLNQAAGAKTAFTATTQGCFIYNLGVYIPVDVSGTGGGGFTGISVQSTDVAPVEFISAANGAVANLTAGKILSFAGQGVVASAKAITLTIGGAATGLACNAIIFATFRPVVAGGYLVVS